MLYVEVQRPQVQRPQDRRLNPEPQELQGEKPVWLEGSEQGRE